MKNTFIPEIYSLESFENRCGIRIETNCFNCYNSHGHDFYEFEYIVEGEGQCIINGKTYYFSAGDLLFATPMDFHSYQSSDSVKTVTVHFYLDSLNKELALISGMQSCVVECTEEMKQLFMMLLKLRNSESYQFLLCRNLIEAITIMFMQSNKCEEKVVMPKEIMYAIGYIRKKFNEHIDLKNISEKCNYSQTYFSRQFKKYMGMGFVEYLTDVRVSHAKNLLMSSDIPITQIAYECGFRSVRGMNRAFLRKYGCSPSEYKRQNLS